MFKKVVEFIQNHYESKNLILLHEPVFFETDKENILDCIDSTFVSSVGLYVNKFEEKICDFTKSKFAVATVNGTAALHTALIVAGVRDGDEVITQALTFVATANAISYQRANPIFLDSAKDNMGLCPLALERFLEENCKLENDVCINKKTGATIRACIPMHVLGHAVKIDEILSICSGYNITVIEDAAEALGSFSKNRHLGTIAPIGILSFNGNKVITSGGGGMVLVQDEVLAKKVRHLSTTAKIAHSWKFIHDEVGYNYRMPNLNAALGCSQLDNIEIILKDKRETATIYREFFEKEKLQFISEAADCKSNYWLNGLILNSFKERDLFLEITNSNKIMTRPLWELMCDLPPFRNKQCDELNNARFFAERVVNIPSGARKKR